MGLKSPVTRAKAVMSDGAVTLTRRSRRRAAGAVARPVPPAGSGAEGTAVPEARPRMAKRSRMRATRAPSAASVSSRRTSTTRPALDSSRSATQPSTWTTKSSPARAASSASGRRRSTVWSRWTAPSSPSMSGMPSSTTLPRAA